MTIDQLQRQFSLAADDGPAPPTRVVVAEVYRAGVRRRRVRRWFCFAAVGATVAGVTSGAVLVHAQTVGQAPYEAGGPHVAAAPPGGAADPTSCAALAGAISAVVVGALPRGLRWAEPELPAGQETASCAGGGLFWLSFSQGGRTYKLGFEGGTGFTDRGCDPGRRPVTCERFPGGEVGHLDGEEFGVLLSRERGQVYFFLGLTDPGADRPVTTRQLSQAARRVAEEVYG